MRRREVLAVIGAAVSSWDLSARAQVARVRVVGLLSSRDAEESSDLVDSFRKGLRQVGFVENQDVRIEFRWARGHYERLPALASELVGASVEALFAAGGSPSALAAKAATSTVPIVFITSDPVSLGLVASLDHPGGNVTGVSNLATDLPSKSMGLLKQLVPDAPTIAYLINPSNLSAQSNATQASVAASALGIQLKVVRATTSQELVQAFAELSRSHTAAVMVMADAFFDSHRDRIVELSAQSRIVGCYPWRDYVLAGGVMSYGTSLAESYRQAGIYIGRILRGEKPSDLPVMQPTKIELVLNLKAAKAIGLAIPPALLAIADEVIE